ncbi:MAG: hypothetical protein E3J71_06480 [Candidatus Stahlbacteria bacterium]|nr:MAG: hypothetical protein E3J71_06480 [Candidatus Stahlbacteria bacterium]
MSENKNVLAAIGYIPPLFFIPLFLSGDSTLAKHHGRQALVIFAAAALTVLAFRILNLLLGWIVPIKTVFNFLEGALYLLYIGLSVFAAIRAANGDLWRVPILGAYSDRLNI